MVIHSEGPGLGFLIIISVLLAISTVAIILRIWARLEIRSFGTDDWLMVLGYVSSLLLFCCIADYISISYGVGAHADRLTEYQIEQAKKWFLIAGLAYAAATAPVKASICVLILRVTPQRRFRWILYSVIATSTLGSFIRVVTYLARCQPLEAAWNPSKGKCGSPSILTKVTYFFGAVCIITDWICAILPAFVIWSIQLSRKAKIYISVMLAMGVLASIATIIRMRYLLAYQDPKDYVYGITPIAIWSEIECCIGIVAGSLATMRPLLHYLGIRNISCNDHPTTPRTSNVNRQYTLHETRTSVSRITSSYRYTPEQKKSTIEEGAYDGANQHYILPITMPLQIVVENGYEVTVEDSAPSKRFDPQRSAV
ncbi:hypothetical protein P280DRAFT_447850 [Massarina eburnea CBS 473.64]|uniref:Rhodopsin domain-containing protein n=1 Tax=Massarina eburnea CBS 473.64 TaxID=1395130 RepID=A0A6A6S4D1_9PLEO|nr:hypothetical protein P280DRAFT_447850 [Massarina eburnea CBS 473.64]